jgi:hypothetical protein
LKFIRILKIIGLAAALIFTVSGFGRLQQRVRKNGEAMFILR